MPTLATIVGSDEEGAPCNTTDVAALLRWFGLLLTTSTTPFGEEDLVVATVVVLDEDCDSQSESFIHPFGLLPCVNLQDKLLHA